MQLASGINLLKAAQRGMYQDLVNISVAAARDIRAVLIGAADADGVIPRTQEIDVRARIGAIVRQIGGQDGQAYSAIDGLTPLGPFAAQLNFRLVQATAAAIVPHTNFMNKVLPPDVRAALGGSRFPVQEQGGDEQPDLLERLRQLRVFDPNALAEYEAPHTWVDPAGYRLSDRIWRTVETARIRIDAAVEEGIRTGDSAINIANAVEAMLRPDRQPIRTNKPYGTNVSFDAMRLARTEIQRAHAQAALVAARMNPYVEAMLYLLSAQHPKVDICDTFAAGGPNNDGKYPLTGRVPMPVGDTHPQCICYLVSVVVQSVAAVTESLRLTLEESRQINLEPYLTPVQIEAFVSRLLGDKLGALLDQLPEIGRALTPYNG